MSTHPRAGYPFWLLLTLFSLPPLATGCQTTAGNYFANRARDFGECFMIRGGVSAGLGADVKVAGLVHANVGLASYDAMAGIAYGRRCRLYLIYEHPSESDLGLPLAPFKRGLLHLSSARPRDDYVYVEHSCYGLLPGLLSWVRPYKKYRGKGKEAWFWLWGPGPASDPALNPKALVRWMRVHAPDIEVGATVLLLGVRAGFSPGEFLDFLLGWSGVDIAGDDRRLDRRERSTESEAGR